MEGKDNERREALEAGVKEKRRRGARCSGTYTPVHGPVTVT